MVLGRPTRPSRINTKKRWPFHHRGLEWKSSKSRDNWSNGQVWSWSTKRSEAKANRALLRECTGHSKHSLPTPQEMTLYMDITRRSILKSDWLYSLLLKMKKLYIVSKNKIESNLWLTLWTLYCKRSATLNMQANWENLAVTTGLEKVRFYSNSKERQCQRMVKLLHNCVHLTC